MQDPRKLPEYQLWRQEVRRRDGNACRICGVQRNLHIHHIKPLEKYPRFGTELDNGVTLCGNCHTFLNGKEENTNLQTIIEAVTGQYDAQTADQLKRLNGKLCDYLETRLKSSNRSEMNHALYQLFAQLQTYPESLDQFLVLIKHILNAENRFDDGLAVQIAMESIKGSSYKAALQVLNEYEERIKSKRQRLKAIAVAEERRRVATKQPIATLDGHLGQVSSVAYSPDGKTLASAGTDKTIKLWNMETRKVTKTIKGTPRAVLSIAYSPDGKTLAWGVDYPDGQVKLWTVGTSKDITTLDRQTAALSSIVFSPNGDILASGAANGTLKLWAIATRQNIASVQRHTFGITSVAFSPDGDTLASGSADGTVKLWAVGMGQNIAFLDGHTAEVTSVAYSPNGETLASGSTDGTVKLWATATTANNTTLAGHRGRVLSLAYFADGQTLVSAASDKTVKLWAVETGQNIATFGEHASEVSSVACAPDGRTLASGCADGTVKLWDISPWLSTE